MATLDGVANPWAATKRGAGTEVIAGPNFAGRDGTTPRGTGVTGSVTLGCKLTDNAAIEVTVVGAVVWWVRGRPDPVAGVLEARAVGATDEASSIQIESTARRVNVLADVIQKSPGPGAVHLFV